MTETEKCPAKGGMCAVPPPQPKSSAKETYLSKHNEEINKLSSLLTGVAGEYFVAAELSAQGYIASITLRNTRGVDIVCSNEDASKSVVIQVKTNRHSDRNWVLNQKSESFYADSHFYVFVNLNDRQKTPDYFIVPSKIVAKHTKQSHAIWLNTPGRSGIAHNDNTMRHFNEIKEKYLNRWDLLGL